MTRDAIGEITNKAHWIRRYGEGRVCAHEGCDTILNPYNAGEVCEVHRPEPDWYIWDGECFAECPDCGRFRKVTKPKRGVSVCRRCLRGQVHTGAVRRAMVAVDNESAPASREAPGAWPLPDCAGVT